MVDSVAPDPFVCSCEEAHLQSMSIQADYGGERHSGTDSSSACTAVAFGSVQSAGSVRLLHTPRRGRKKIYCARYLLGLL